MGNNYEINHDLIDEFMNALFSSRYGMVKITCGRKQNSVKVKAWRMQTAKRRQKVMEENKLSDENCKVSLCGHNEGKIISERTIRDIRSIVVKVDLLPLGWAEDHFLRFVEQLRKELTKHGKEDLLPTYMVASDKLFFVYTFTESGFHNMHDVEKKGKVFRLLRHIQDGLCCALNTYVTIGRFVSANFSDQINLPGTQYVVYNRKKDDSAGIIRSKEAHRGAVQIIKIGVARNVNDWKRVAGVPDIKDEHRETHEPKIHIKDREFYSVEGMLERRLRLIEAIIDSFFFDLYTQEQVYYIIFMYYNFSFSIRKNVALAEQETINAFWHLFVNLGRDHDDRMKKMRKHMHLPDDFITEGYYFKDETFFDKLWITREQAADLGYVTEDKAAYDRAYSQARRDRVRKEKEARGEARWQKTEKILAETKALLEQGISQAEISRIQGVSRATITDRVRKIEELENTKKQKECSADC